MRNLPSRFTEFTETYPEIARAYEQLGAACHLAGPIPKKERALLKLGISMGAWLEGAVHSHVRKSLEAGATPEEIRALMDTAIQKRMGPGSQPGLEDPECGQQGSAAAGGSDEGVKSPGNSRTGSPRASQTPFEPSLTVGPV